MNFVSFAFLIFLFIVVLLYYVIPHKYRWIVLLIASLVFYGWWNYKLLYLIIGTTLISYSMAIGISKAKTEKIKKLFLSIAIISSLSVLLVFKYLNFFLDSVIKLINLMGASADEIVLSLILPIGISFYTFQTLSYVVDVYRGDIAPEYHLGYYALFVMFFPQLVAGPIERPSHLIPQLKQEHKFSMGNLSNGALIAIVGYFKKVVVADSIAIYVNTIYNNPANATGFQIGIATVLFAFQIYCDFSGYTDIAIGCAKMLGVDLIDNFNKPYLAESIKDFWARWHISLTTWFRDYLYIPLGGNRVSKWRFYLNVAIVFIVSGLWHGANWTFLLWGVLHAIYRIVSLLTKDLRSKVKDKLRIEDTNQAYIAWKKIFTFILVCIAWICFRANSVGDLGILFKNLFANWNFSVGYFDQSLSDMGLNILSMLSVTISIFAIPVMNKIKEIVRNQESELVIKENTTIRMTRAMIVSVSCLLVLFVAISLIENGGESSFIYFQF